MKKYGFMILTLLSIEAACQTNDSFSDGDFTTNPVWIGSASHFIINASLQLQLNDISQGSSYLSTVFSPSLHEEVDWQLFVKHGFSSSGSNFSRIYLTSDQADLSQPLNGYYLQLGESGSNDAVELFRQDGLTSTSICRAANGKIASSFAIRILVKHEATSSWSLLIDYSGGKNYQLEAQGPDSSTIPVGWLGVLCTYTSSNATKFYFDDFIAGGLLRDTDPPGLTSAETAGPNSVLIRFSEPIDSSTATVTTNYTVSGGLGNPSRATLQSDGSSVLMHFQNALTNGLNYDLTVAHITDVGGNAMNPTSIQFTYFVPAPQQFKDIIFTEILADPAPTVGLPETEYVELYNRSSNPVDVNGWTFSDGVSTAVLPDQIILPHQYWLIVPSASLNLFPNIGSVIPVTGFPSLNNDGDAISLGNADGKLIDSVNYNIDMYHDNAKESGGWSLEIIDLENPCSDPANWTASEDELGGTPGQANSVNADKPDITGPALLSAVPLSEREIELTFDEGLDSHAPSTSSFALSPAVSVSSCGFVGRSLTSIRLVLEGPLAYRQLYEVTVSNVYDCNGNNIQADFDHATFALPEAADSLDILLNEVLFNPRPGGVDFVEVYNASAKFINLKNWKLANADSNSVTNFKSISTHNYLFPPGGFLAFTSDPYSVSSQYRSSDYHHLVKMEMPSLPDDHGSIRILTDSSKAIDSFVYDKGFHSQLVKDEEGVSLERITFSAPTNSAANWTSGLAETGFATPGLPNGNARPTTPVAKGNIDVEPEFFIPETGTPDFIQIHYSFDHPGYAANIRILDQQGRLLKVIANNQVLGYDGFFRWDGDRDDGGRVRIGYYVVWAEVVDLAGTVTIFRKRAIVIGK